MKKKEVTNFNRENAITGVSSRGYGRTYFAKKDFKLDEEVMRGYGRIVDHQTAHQSVQIGPAKHYVPEKWTGGYWDHSCRPNTYMRTRKDGFPSLHALMPIKKGEEVTYAYSMSEYAWAPIAEENQIYCRCGIGNKHKIPSFSQLSTAKQKELVRKSWCGNYLMKMIRLP